MRIVHRPEMFVCRFCHRKLSVIYREWLPDGRGLCFECRLWGCGQDRFQGVRERPMQAWMMRTWGFTVKEVARFMRVRPELVRAWIRLIAYRVKDVVSPLTMENER